MPITTRRPQGLLMGLSLSILRMCHVIQTMRITTILCRLVTTILQACTKTSFHHTTAWRIIEALPAVSVVISCGQISHHQHHLLTWLIYHITVPRGTVYHPHPHRLLYQRTKIQGGTNLVLKLPECPPLTDRRLRDKRWTCYPLLLPHL